MVDRHQLKLGPLAALAALAAPAALAIPPAPAAPAAGARRVPVPLLGGLGEARLGQGMLGRADEDVALVPVAVEEAQVLRGDALLVRVSAGLGLGLGLGLGFGFGSGFGFGFGFGLG